MLRDMYKDIYKLEHSVEEGEITCLGPGWAIVKEAEPGSGHLGRGLAGREGFTRSISCQ